MGKLAFIFPGQGSQTVGMGKALVEAFPQARSVFDAADDALGEKLSTLCFEGPDDALKLTANTQPAILTASVAVNAVLNAKGIKPDFVAGHSLGEYSALVAASALRLPDAVRAVRARGTFMQEAVPTGVGAMAAVLGLAPDKVKEACDQASQEGQICSPANYNSPEQTVIAGHAAAVERAQGLLKEKGARKVVTLPVSAPFHCALMEPVKARLSDVLSKIAFSAPAVSVVANVDAKANADAKRIIPLLLEQVSAPVRWVECVEELGRLGVSRVVEVGPGKVLSGLVKRISKEIEIFNVEDPASLEKTLAALGVP